MRSMVCIIAVGLFVVSVRSGAAEDGGPVTLEVTQRVELGPAFVQTHYMDRWSASVVTAEGHVAMFYTAPDRTIRYVLTRDGKAFDKPVTVGRGMGPSVTMDPAGNILLAYKSPRGRVAVKKLTRTGAGQWDASAEPTEPVARFGGQAEQLPTILVIPPSPRIWLSYNFVPVDLKAVAAAVGIKHKLRSDPVMTYSDDGGETWAEPVYIGSDSGDIGTGMVSMRSFRGRPAWLWAYWDCAPPAWGFFDGSHARPLREFFAHYTRRTAAWHPWDTLEMPDGKMYFATGLDHRLRGQLYKYFDGSKWSEEVILAAHFGKMVLAGDGQRAFLLAAEGPRPRGKRITVYELDGLKATRKPEPLYVTPEGRLIHRFHHLPRNRKTKGYFPMFVIEETPQDTGQLVRGRKKFTFTDPKLVYLRAEVVPLDPKAAAAEAAKPLLDETKLPKGQEKYYKPLPTGDRRREPRTDVSKDRKIVRAGNIWILAFTEDNPGRLLAARIAAGKVAPAAPLVGRPGWNRYQCSAAAAGMKSAVAAVGNEGIVVVGALADNLPVVSKVIPNSRGCGWPSVCFSPDGDVLVAAVTGGGVSLLSVPLAPHEKAYSKAFDVQTPNPRPALLAAGPKAWLLAGGDAGISCAAADWQATGKGELIVRERWIGQHFSAAANGETIDLIYTPRASHLGRRLVGHVRREGGKWKQMPPVDEGNFIQGLSLCSLGGGRLLAVYSQRIDRPDKPAKGVERLRRFHYVIKRRTFDGKKWSDAVEVPFPGPKDELPKDWKGLNRAKGLAWVPADKRGMFPTLPANADASEPIPLAWMVPGFDCVVRTWPRYSQGRGGMLMTTEIMLRE